MNIARDHAGLAFRIYAIWEGMIPACLKCRMEVTITPDGIVTMRARAREPLPSPPPTFTRGASHVSMLEIESAYDQDGLIRWNLSMACVNVCAGIPNSHVGFPDSPKWSPPS